MTTVLAKPALPGRPCEDPDCVRDLESEVAELFSRTAGLASGPPGDRPCAELLAVLNSPTRLAVRGHAVGSDLLLAVARRLWRTGRREEDPLAPHTRGRGDR